MKQALSLQEMITLNEVGTSRIFSFQITELVGIGSSCIVYTAVYNDAEGNSFPVRLKECYPAELEITRESDNSLSVPEEQRVRLDALLEHFTQGYQKQMMLRQVPESMNSISNIQGIYEGNNTKYIAMSCQNGMCLSKVNDLTLYDIFRVVKAVVQQIDNLHRQGYLYLDLKPENIFLYPETPELVMLFDFDSAVRLEELLEHPEWLSFTEQWAAPEVLRESMRKLGWHLIFTPLGHCCCICCSIGIRNCQTEENEPHGKRRCRVVFWQRKVRNAAGW